MDTTTITTQAQADYYSALERPFEVEIDASEPIRMTVMHPASRIIIYGGNVTIGGAGVLGVHGEAYVEASGVFRIEAAECATVSAQCACIVHAFDDAHVRAFDDTVVIANGHASVDAYGRAVVIGAYKVRLDARDESRAVAMSDSVHVVARDRSRVWATEHGVVTALGDAYVERSQAERARAIELFNARKAMYYPQEQA